MRRGAGSSPLVRQFAATMFEQLLRYSPDAVVIVDQQGKIVEVNAAAERMFLFTRAELIGQAIEILVPAPFRNQHVAQRTAYTSQPHTRAMGAGLDLNAKRKDGSEFPVDIMLSPAETAEGRFILSVIRDVSEQKQAQEALRRSEQQFRSLLESIKDYAIFLLDCEGRVASWNPGAERLKGYTAQEIIGQHFSLFYTQEDRERGKPQEELSLARIRGHLEDEGWRIRKDGSRFWAKVVISTIRDAKGEVVGFSKVTGDFTARKETEGALAQQSEFLRGIINTVREPLLVLDSTFHIIAVNESFLRTFSTSLEQTANKVLYRIGNEQWNITKLRALLEEVLPKDHAVTNFEVEQEFENIGRRRMVLNARRLFQTNERQPMILLAIEDITERKLAEAALIKSEKLAASGRLAAALAHEINNPLQAVANLIALLGRSPKLDEQDRQYATLAKRELGRVVHLVRQSLGFYRESASPTAVNLEEVLESVLNLYTKQIEAKQITVTKQYRVDGTIQSYPAGIRQVFSTLLVNAMEASSKGCRIVLRASTSSDWRNPAVRGVRITLADTGGGIPADNTVRIFEPFFTTKGDGGTGLGLWVAHGIVHRLGGSIRVRSTTRPGKSGTAFSVFVPHRT